MLYSYKIATLNINVISFPLKMQTFNNFLLRQDINIALLQEVTTTSHPLCGYEAFINEGIDKRGTAILLEEGIYLNNIKRLTFGGGIAGVFRDAWIIYICASA
jgi:exonuclease III